MAKKYELTDKYIEVNGRNLYQIKAVRSFGNVKAGDLGGYIESESNLSHDDNAWVCDNARVYGNARVYDNAWVHGDAHVYGNALICDDAKVYGNVLICGDAEIVTDSDYATIGGFGTEHRTTTFFRYKDNCVRVVCGCFFGTIDEFREQVRSTREGKIAEEYLMIADLMEMHFEKEEKE